MRLGRKFFFLLLQLFIITNCTTSGPLTRNQESLSTTFQGPEKFSIVFSHNINGETHPCGCRHFPLGGLPQVAGLLHKLRKEGPLVYLDTGDTLFSLSNIPKELSHSSRVNADNLVLALEKLNLNFFLPGDQDFAQGESYLNQISQKSSFSFLISNLTSHAPPFKHRPWHVIKVGPYRLYLLALLHPHTLSASHQKFVHMPEQIFPTLLKKLNQLEYNQNNPLHKLMVLSHAGMEEDKKLAELYPQIDWIVGAHSQDFLRSSIKIGKTQIVQTLSRNHYLGQIFPFKSPKGPDEENYILWEIRDELHQHLSPNPFFSFIDQHKELVGKAQKKEQAELPSYSPQMKLPHPISCKDCHAAQTEHWQKTPHALAYYTLIRVKEEKNTHCIGCHTVGFKAPHGYTKGSEIIDRADLPEQEKNKQEEWKTKYWQDLRKQMESIKAVRNLPPDKIKVYAQKWYDLDQEYNVQSNFANVQCLNCHSIPLDHPFQVQNTVTEDSPEKKLEKMGKTCLKCHTADQSPEWYHRDKNGLPQKVDEVQLLKKIKLMGHSPQ